METEDTTETTDITDYIDITETTDNMETEDTVETSGTTVNTATLDTTDNIDTADTSLTNINKLDGSGAYGPFPLAALQCIWRPFRFPQGKLSKTTFKNGFSPQRGMRFWQSPMCTFYLLLPKNSCFSSFQWFRPLWTKSFNVVKVSLREAFSHQNGPK